jgi:tripeptide aminopeptidase
MHPYLDKLPQIVETVRSLKDAIITNIVLIGQTPSPTFKEKRRTEAFMDRLSEYQVDECTTDGYRNPIGIIRGRSRQKPPIFVVAHLDTFFHGEGDFNYRVGEDFIRGPGITDNSVGVAVLVSLPEIFRQLGLAFESDIVLAGVIQSMGKGNLRGIRHLLKTWSTPIRGAVIVEGTKLGRINYYSAAMVRVEIECRMGSTEGGEPMFRPNAILVVNDVINRVLQLRLPQRPRSRVIFGKINGGFKHGIIACDATLGLEIQSDADAMVKSIYNDIRDIVEGTSHEYGVDLAMKTISNVGAANLRYNHPLVKSVGEIIRRLDLKPASANSESELSIFLSRKIPAVTLGVTRGINHHLEDATMEIEPMFRGIAQIVAAIMAIDSGVCDERLA